MLSTRDAVFASHALLYVSRLPTQYADRSAPGGSLDGRLPVAPAATQLPGGRLAKASSATAGLYGGGVAAAAAAWPLSNARPSTRTRTWAEGATGCLPTRCSQGSPGGRVDERWDGACAGMLFIEGRRSMRATGACPCV